MLKFGNYVMYNNLVYKVVAVSEDATPTYTLAPVRRKTVDLNKTITTTKKQNFLVGSGGAEIASVALGDTILIGNQTAMAKTLAEDYIKIQFESNGGTDVACEVIADGAIATEPDDPTKEHYTFDAWYTDDSTFASAVTFASDTFDDDTTIYADWVIDTFDVTYDSNEGSAVASEEDIDYDTVATEPSDPTLASNDFAGWFTDDTTFLVPFVFTTTIVADITLYAKWTVSE